MKGQKSKTASGYFYKAGSFRKLFKEKYGFFGSFSWQMVKKVLFFSSERSLQMKFSEGIPSDEIFWRDSFRWDVKKVVEVVLFHLKGFLQMRKFHLKGFLQMRFSWKIGSFSWQTVKRVVLFHLKGFRQMSFSSGGFQLMKTYWKQSDPHLSRSSLMEAVQTLIKIVQILNHIWRDLIWAGLISVVLYWYIWSKVTESFRFGSVRIWNIFVKVDSIL